MVADTFTDLVNWLIQSFIYPLFPDNFPLLSYNSYYNILESLKGNFIFTFSFVEKFFPIQLLLTFLVIIIVAEIVLFGIKAMMWLLNLIRGSGA